MHKEVFIFGALMIIAAFAFVLMPGTVLTGEATNTDADEKGLTYAYTLNDWVRDFFNVYLIQFPDNECGRISDLYYTNIGYKDITTYEAIPAVDTEKALTLLFGQEDRMIGALDMVYGQKLTENTESDSVMSLLTHTGIRIPPGYYRDTYVELVLEGDSGQVFDVNKGRLRTAMLDCQFSKTECHCKAQRRYDYGSDDLTLEDWEY